jgi:glycolate oxidase
MYHIAVDKYHGTVTAEHGTGLLRKPYMNIMFSNEEIRLMERIKRAFDPNCILNPGVIVD